MEVGIQFHTFLAMMLDGEQSALHPCHFIPQGQVHGNHWLESWIDSRACSTLDVQN
jgi:hypothetical protein